jgi:alpha-L-fucosidase
VDDNNWLVHIEKSDSSSRNWQKINVDNDSFGVIQPTILRYAGNRMQMLCRSRQNSIIQSWSSDNGNTWSPLTKTNMLNPNSGIDGVTTDKGLQVLVYNPSKHGKEWFEGRTELRVAVSTDGNLWKDVYTLIKEKEGEFSYPAIIQTRDGNLHITFTYNRKNIRHVILKL